jgi:hypothetical protein
MKKVLGFGLVVLAMTLGSSLARAQFVLNPAFTYMSHTVETNVGKGESTLLSVDLHAGYLMSSGLFLGGFYGYETEGSVNTDFNATSLAPTIGYFGDGFLALFSYHFMASRETGVNSKLVDGSGPQIDIGYVLPVTGSFSIGPQFRWRSIDYDKEEQNGVETAVSYKITQIHPMISLWFQF